MSVVLYMLGSLTTAAGLGLVGFGIPINEFSLGNTLIIAGTSAIVGGLVVIGLAAVHAQLRRLGDAQIARPAARAARPAEAAEPAPVGGPRPSGNPPAPRVPFPQRPRPETREPRAPESRGQEPRLSTRETPEEAPSERPRPSFGPVFHNDLEPSVAEANEETPLSPRAPSRLPPQMPASASPSDQFSFDRKVWSSGPGRPASNAPIGRSSPAAAPARPPRSERFPVAERPPASDRPPSSGLFDAVWPAGSRSGGSRSGANGARDAATDQPIEHDAAAPKSESEPVPMAILKSGVVDGMAYTLYTDGSIEAELAQGVMRFSSIEELRTHLEKSA